jgi:hypothetical protein
MMGHPLRSLQGRSSRAVVPTMLIQTPVFSGSRNDLNLLTLIAIFTIGFSTLVRATAGK